MGTRCGSCNRLGLVRLGRAAAAVTDVAICGTIVSRIYSRRVAADAAAAANAATAACDANTRANIRTAATAAAVRTATAVWTAAAVWTATATARLRAAK